MNAMNVADTAQQQQHSEDCDDHATCEPFDCDCCRTSTPSCRIARVRAFGIETYACEECRR
jgi:hypothetical protein